MTRREFSPAMAGSVALHGAVAAALMISWNFSRELKTGAVVPVTIVSNAPDPDVRPAEQAPMEQAAQTEVPDPTAPAQSAPPEPQPEPVPPKPVPTPPKPAPTPPPTPRPAPTPTPAPKAPAKPAPAKPTPPKKAESSFDLDALEASLSKSAKAPPRPSSAARGPARPETALEARTTVGSGTSGAAVQGMQDELQRRWNPNCNVEGGRDVLVRVTFRLNAGGQVIGDPTTEIRSARSAVAIAAADRAVRAVYAAAPFRSLPREFYGGPVAVNFNAKEACS